MSSTNWCWISSPRGRDGREPHEPHSCVGELFARRSDMEMREKRACREAVSRLKLINQSARLALSALGSGKRASRSSYCELSLPML